MSRTTHPSPFVAIACGGTGGHLFPGVAVAEALLRRGCAVMLLVSTKEVDQQAVRDLADVEVAALPAVGLTRGRFLAFLRGFRESYAVASGLFRGRMPHAVLAMGGFTSAPPVLAARRLGAFAFLHESNTIPGRANRWLSWMVGRAFIGFPSAASRLHCRNVTVTGMPVRPQIGRRDPGACRTALGLDPSRPVVLVMGGSQGASGVNEAVERSLPEFARRQPSWQWFHLAGPLDAERMRQAYAGLKLRAVVHPFFTEMELALGAATAAVSRAGASSLAELAAARLPAVLVPYPAATDNHQFHNAAAYERSGSARLLEQKDARVENLAPLLRELVEVSAVRAAMQAALAAWHAPEAAELIAEAMLTEAWRGGRLDDSNVPSSSSDPGSQRDRLALTPSAASAASAGRLLPLCFAPEMAGVDHQPRSRRFA